MQHLGLFIITTLLFKERRRKKNLPTTCRRDVADFGDQTRTDRFNVVWPVVKGLCSRNKSLTHNYRSTQGREERKEGREERKEGGNEGRKVEWVVCVHVELREFVC